MDILQSGMGILGQALGVLSGLLGFLGVTGIVLFVLSLILLGLLGAFSPLPKIVNYIAVVGLLTGLTLFGIEGFGDLPSRAEAIRGYLIVMLAPVVAVFGLKWAFGAIFRGRSETDQLKEAITELTEQVAALRRDRQGERLDARAADLEVTAQEPRRLLPLPRLLGNARIDVEEERVAASEKESGGGR
ncbi:MAG: hypothetical protein AAF830_08000 [Pseudomonadota bacterium]